MKRNKKMTITALSVMLVMALAVSVLTFFSSADDSDNPGTANDIPVVAADASATKTIIDYIIENSYTGDDPVYRVVEVGSGSNPSGLKAYVENLLFEQEVINGHKNVAAYDVINAEVTLSNGTTSAPIVYSYYDASKIGNKTKETENSTPEELATNAALAAISNADFIYLSNDSSNPFSMANDLSEDLYGALVAHATTNFRPFVIDSPTKEDDIESGTDQKTLSQLASSAFDVSGQYYYTFGWDQTKQTAEQFLSHKQGSLYLGIRGTKVSGNWVEIPDPVDPAAASKKLAKVLLVSTAATPDATLFNEFLLTGVAQETLTLADGTEVQAYPLYASDASGAITESLMYQYGYNGRYERPDYVQIETVTLNDAGIGSDLVELNSYDMVVIDSCYGGSTTISVDVYKKLLSAMYANVSIIYDKSISAGGSTSGGSGGTGDRQETNYKELYYDVAYADDTPQDDNILVTNRTTFQVILDSGTGDTLADLINKSAFRSIGGRSSSSDKFTVLELQPCYPIDEEVAIASGEAHPRTQTAKGNDFVDVFGAGNYYTSPADVKNGVTKEEVDPDTEYYAWELSEAKIVDAIPGLNSVDDVKLVQMSTEEFAANKTAVLGTYDLVYIGGNTSALKDVMQYMSAVTFSGWGGTLSKQSGSVTLDNVKNLPIYSMYTHVGDIVQTDVIPSILGEKGHKPANGTPTATVYLNGQKQNTFAVMNGNDITYDKKQELIAYINAGYPVVVSKQASEAYEAVRDFGYSQNSIDPDCNMADVLAACYDRQDRNVLWNFNYKRSYDGTGIVEDGTIKINPGDSDKELGDTKTGYVVVFNDDSGSNTDYEGNVVSSTGDKDKLVSLYNTSTQRPKLTVTKEPKTYNLYDPDSIITDSTLNFEFEIRGGANIGTRLYIDDDGNSTFTATEIMGQGTATNLTYSLAPDFAGPLYWKLEVYDTKTNLPLAYKTGISYVTNGESSKKQVSVLQILPAYNKIGNVDTAESEISLYFCPICQQSYERLDYNPIANGGDVTASEGYNDMYGGNYEDSANGYMGSIYLGKHEHIFGIVRYDSALEIPTKGGQTGRDDWYYNLADELSDSFTFDLDIIYRNELDEWAKEVREEYPEGMSDEEKEAKIESYETQLNDTNVAYYDALDETEMYEEGLREMIQQMIDNADRGTFGSCTRDQFVQEMRRLLDKRNYSDYFSISTRAAQYNEQSAKFITTPVTVDGKDYRTFPELYADYVTAKDKKIDAKKDYYKYLRLSNPDDWLSACYSSVILGPAEDFCNDDVTGDSLTALTTYIENDGQLILFHDVLTYAEDANSAELTKAIRALCGQEKNPLTIDYDQIDGDATAYPYLPYKVGNVPYKTVPDATDQEKYFISNLSAKDPTDTTRYRDWFTELGTAFSGVNQWVGKKYLTNVAYSDGYYAYAKSAVTFAAPYKYADADMTISGFWYQSASFNAKDNDQYGTNRATQNNGGIITTYPFTIKPTLAISGTHSQSYAVDLEQSDLTVWYTLAGGTNENYVNGKKGSSLFAASPNDGTDNYFLYSYKNIFYCGAGHSKVTGMGKDNNDERMLYINIICNSVRSSARQPGINVYDPDSTMDDLKNDVVKDDGSGQYVLKVDDMESYPEFSFLITGDNDFDVSNIKIFYDLDYDDPTITNKNAYVNNDKHVLIADWYSGTGTSFKDLLLYVLRTNTNLIADPTTNVLNLKLRPEYFAPYGNKYTYIVIAVTDKDGGVYYRRIKIQLKDYLFNLT